MWDTMVVLIVLGAAGLFTVKAFYKVFSSKSESCACSPNCPYACKQAGTGSCILHKGGAVDDRP